MCRKAVLRDKLCWFDRRINHCLIICMLFPIFAKGGRSCPVSPPAGAQASALASAAGRHLLVTVSTLVLISALIWRRPLLSVWSVPHRLGTLATQRLWMFIIQSGWRRGGGEHAQIWICVDKNQQEEVVRSLTLLRQHCVSLEYDRGSSPSGRCLQWRPQPISCLHLPNLLQIYPSSGHIKRVWPVSFHLQNI